MLDLTKPAALAILLAMAGAAAQAQDSAAPETPADPPAGSEAQTPAETPAEEAPAEAGQAPADPGLSMGEEVGGIGSTYVEAVHGDWEMRCIRTEDGADPCNLYQLLKDGEGNSVAEISVFNLPDGGQAAAGATIVTPLETLLTQQVTLQVDSGKARRYPFSWCSPMGCVSRVGFTAAEVAEFKRGAKANITIVPVAAPDQKVTLDLSLKGFTAGYDAVAAANTAAAGADGNADGQN